VALITGKCRRIFSLAPARGAEMLLKAGLAMLFFVSLIIVGMHWTHFSRTMAYGTVMAYVGLELLLLAIYHRVQGKAIELEFSREGLGDFSRPLAAIDLVMLVGAFFAVTYYKQCTFELSAPYDDILLIMLGFWLAGSLVTRKFAKDNFHDFFVAIGPAVKTVLFMAAGMAFCIFLFRLGPISRIQVFGPVVVLFALETAVFWMYVSYREHGRGNGDIVDHQKVREILSAEKGRVPLETGPECPVTDPAGEKLKNALDFFDPRIFEMLASHVDLDNLDRKYCSLLSTDNIFNLDVLESGGMHLIINLHKLNDMRWFNRYFLLAHEKLAPGSYFMGKAHTISTHRQYFKDKYPKYLGSFYWGLSFVWGRVFPKLPWLKMIYFSITRGKGRRVSRAEILGRLCFCGFKIVDEQEFGHRFFFIAKKATTPSTNENPTYGPLVQLQRSGLGGRPIKVYKFRTMYPFSEFLQDYVYEKNSLAEGGKFKDDFRVTGWGRFMRRTWLDELPMLYNWIRGDLQLVGVRPLSRQYLELYDEDLKELRKKVKPGLLPPFYADMPESLEEIMESERKYIRAYLNRPMRTQMRYFGVGVWNIVVRGGRSG
jgi:hypothetical protein